MCERIFIIGSRIANVLCMIFRILTVAILLLFSKDKFAYANQSISTYENKKTSVQVSQTDQDRSPTILIVYVLDGSAFVKEDALNTKSVLRFLFPEHDIKLVVHDESLSNHDIEGRIAKKIRQELDGRELITHLFIGTHGTFNLLNSKTYLAHMGSFGPDRVDSSFHRVFSSIRNQISEDLVVFFDSCLTFCSSNEINKQKAETILKYFNAQNGTVVGSMGLIDVDAIPRVSPYISPKREDNVSSEVLRRTILAASILLVSADLLNIWGADGWAAWTAFVVNSISLLSLGSLELKQQYIEYLYGVKFLNKIKVFKAKEGKVYQALPRSLPEDFTSIFNPEISCKGYFL